VVSDLMSKAMRSSDTTNMARNIVKTPAMRENLSILLGEQRATDLIETLQRQAQGTDTYRRVFEGSKTAESEAARRLTAGAENAEGFWSAAGDLRPISAIKNLMSPERTPRDVMNPRVANNVLELMRAGDPDAISFALNALRRNTGAIRPWVAPALTGGINAVVTGSQ